MGNFRYLLGRGFDCEEMKSLLGALDDIGYVFLDCSVEEKAVYLLRKMGQTVPIFARNPLSFELIDAKWARNPRQANLTNDLSILVQGGVCREMFEKVYHLEGNNYRLLLSRV